MKHSLCSYRDGVGQEHNGDDHEEARDIRPGPLQRGCDHVQLRVESHQVPQFDGSQQHQEGDQVAQHCIGCGRLVETGKSAHIVKPMKCVYAFINITVTVLKGLHRPRYTTTLTLSIPRARKNSLDHQERNLEKARRKSDPSLQAL